jgi:Spy/CpxP family protein refolding chaperone
MKRLSIGVLALAIVVLASRGVFAQRGQGRGSGAGGFGPSNLMLLSQESVQSELKLSEDQVKKVDEQLAKQREAMAGLRDLDQQERRTKLQEQLKANDAVVTGVLNDAQAKRLKQIMLQQRGPAALADAELAETVGLTSAQKEKIQSIQQTAQEERRAQFQGGGGGGDREEMRKKLEAARTATNEKITALLTPEQKDKWKAMTGEPFKGEIRAPQFRRGNRPGGAGVAPRRNPVAATTSTRSVFRLAAYSEDKPDDKAADERGGDPPPRPRHRHEARGGDRQQHARHGHHPPGPRADRAERAERGPGVDHRRPDHRFAARGRHNGRWDRHRAGGPRFAMRDGHHGPYHPDFEHRRFAHHDGPRGDFGPPSHPRAPHPRAHDAGYARDHRHNHFASWRSYRDDHPGRWSGPDGRFGSPPRGDDDRPQPGRFDRGRHERSGGIGPHGFDAAAQIAQLQRQLDGITRELASLRRELRSH